MQTKRGPTEVRSTTASNCSTSVAPEGGEQQPSSSSSVWQSPPQATLTLDNHDATCACLCLEDHQIEPPSSPPMLINGLEAGQPITGEGSGGGFSGYGGPARSPLDGRSAHGSGGLSSDTTCDNTPAIATPNNEPASHHLSEHELASQTLLSLASQLSSSSNSTPLEIGSLNLWSNDNESSSGGGAPLAENSHYTYDSNHHQQHPLAQPSSSPSPYFGYESPGSEASSSNSNSYSLSYDDDDEEEDDEDDTTNSQVSSSQLSSSLSPSSSDSDEQSDDVDSSSDSGTHDYDYSSGLSQHLDGGHHQMEFQTDSEAFSPHGPNFTVQIDVFPDENGNLPAIYIDHGNGDDGSSTDHNPEDGEGEEPDGASHQPQHAYNLWTPLPNGTQPAGGGVGVGASYGLPDTDEEGDDHSYNEDDDEDDEEDGELDNDDYEDDFDEEAAMDVSEDQAFYLNNSAFPSNPALLVDINGLSLFPNAVAQFFGNANAEAAGFLAAVAAAGQNDDEVIDVGDPFIVHDFERNSSFSDFCKNLRFYYEMDPIKHAEFKISPHARDFRSFERPPEITAADVERGSDLQGIPWEELEIEPERARRARNAHYVNYANLIDRRQPERLRTLLPNTRKFYRFKRTDNRVKVRFTHFQLRNLVSVASNTDVFYTNDYHVLRYDAGSQTSEVTMDLLNTAMGDPIKITTIAGMHGVLLAGGFNGEYAMKALDAPVHTKPVEGIVTNDNNGITNHIHVFSTRMSGVPHAAFSSNDTKLRILDCTTNTFVAEHAMAWAINCSATSPCGRLRAIVGDSKEVVITDSERGTILNELPGHLDYGFACAWAEDGYTIATGNQDMMVRIYDARNFSRSVASIDAEIAGVRTLRFSPLGSGPRVLAMAEPADFISIVDAVDFQTQQKYDIFGEIGGLGFTPDCGDLFVANADKNVGGMIQFERRGEGRLVSGMDWMPEENLRQDRAKRRRKGYIIDGPYLY